MKKIRLTTVLLFALIGLSASAQNDFVMPYMRLCPSANYYNPASFVSQKFYIGIPVMTNFSMNFSNNFINYDKMFKTDADGRPVSLQSTETMLGALSETGNKMALDAEFNALDLGIRLGRITIMVTERLKMQNGITFSKDLFGLVVNGNLNYCGEGNEASIDLGINSSLYAETSVGVQIELTRRLYVGGRAKLLNGVYNIQSNHIGFNLSTDPDTYEMTISNFGADVDVMAIEDIDYSEGIPQCFVSCLNDMESRSWGIGDALRYSNKNRGVALDLGVVYRLSDHFGVSLAATDLGYIHWNCDGAKLVGDTTHVFSGFTMQDLKDTFGGDSASFSIDEYFPYQVDEKTFDLKQSLTPTYLAEAYFQLGKSRITGSFRKRGDVVAMTGAASLCLSNFISVCGSVTKLNYTDAPVLGLGAEINLGFANLYLMTSNSVLSLDKNANADLSNVNLKVGALINFGNAKERRVNVKEADKSSKSSKSSKKNKKVNEDDDLDLDDLLAPQTEKNKPEKVEKKAEKKTEINVYEPSKNNDIETKKEEKKDDINVYEPSKTESSIDDIIDDILDD